MPLDRSGFFGILAFGFHLQVDEYLLGGDLIDFDTKGQEDIFSRKPHQVPAGIDIAQVDTDLHVLIFEGPDFVAPTREG